MRQEIPPSVGGDWEGPRVLLTRSVSISSSGGVGVRGDETSDETERRGDSGGCGGGTVLRSPGQCHL